MTTTSVPLMRAISLTWSLNNSSCIKNLECSNLTKKANHHHSMVVQVSKNQRSHTPKIVALISKTSLSIVPIRIQSSTTTNTKCVSYWTSPSPLPLCILIRKKVMLKSFRTPSKYSSTTCGLSWIVSITVPVPQILNKCLKEERSSLHSSKSGVIKQVLWSWCQPMLQ